MAFGGETRLSGSGPTSRARASRSGANTLALIAQHPWLGVGFGEFNFAWTLTPFPDRPIAFFDHTHNLLLQLGVELGVPLAAARARRCWATRSGRRCGNAIADGREPRRAAYAPSSAPPS